MEKIYFRDLLTNNINDANVVITSIPFDGNCSVKKGASLAPETMKELSSYLPPFTMDGKKIDNVRIYDNGNIVDENNLFAKIAKTSQELFKTNKFNIFFGGDHSVSIELENQFIQRAKELNKIPAIIHIDAHPDFCDFYDDSYNSHACTNARSKENGCEYENFTLIGIRGFEEQEVNLFKNHPEIKVFLASDIYNNGMSQVIEYLAAKYDDKYLIYLSYDIDANDPSYAPGTGTPEAFGLNSHELMLLLVEIFKKLPIFAFDIVEVSPALDINDITSWLALKTLYEILFIIGERK